MNLHAHDDGLLAWYAAGMAPARRQALQELAAASEYAWIQLTDPAMRAEYESNNRTKKSADARAVDDFRHAPEIRSVNLEQYTGRAGEAITLHVIDDFKVAGVRLELLDANGTIIEQGEAREQSHTRWCYHTKLAVAPFGRLTLVITAYDIPGNTDQHTIHLLPGPGTCLNCQHHARQRSMAYSKPPSNPEP